MFYWLIPLSIGIVLLAVFLYFRVKEQRVTAVIIKGFVSLMFIVTAIVAWLTSSNPQSIFPIFVLIALFFGLLGDILLDIKYITTTRELLFTRLGFIAFGVGHIFYITGLLVCFYNFSSSVLYFIIPITIGLALMGVTLALEKVGPLRYGNMRLFVAVYSFLLFLVTSIYMSVAIQSGWATRTVWIMAIAMLSFALSDLILNNTYFASGFNKPIFVIVNHVTYYIAQFAIALSLFFLM